MWPSLPPVGRRGVAQGQLGSPTGGRFVRKCRQFSNHFRIGRLLAWQEASPVLFVEPTPDRGPLDRGVPLEVKPGEGIRTASASWKIRSDSKEWERTGRENCMCIPSTGLAVRKPSPG